MDAGIDGLARMSYLEHKEQGLLIELVQWNALTRPYFEGLEQRVAKADPGQGVHEFHLSDLTPKAAVLGQLGRFTLNKLLGRVESTRPKPGKEAAA